MSIHIFQNYNNIIMYIILQEHGINRLPCVMVLKDGKAIVYKGTVIPILTTTHYQLLTYMYVCNPNIADSLSGYTLSRWVGIEK